MNANELAEAMEIRASIRRKATSRKSVQEGANDRLADQLENAATMLRQQQAEIEAFEKLISEIKYEKSSGVYEMNNEPVAYIDPYDLERLPHYDCHIGSQQLKNGIPLYTHPVKELHLSLQKSKQTGELLAVTYTDDEHRIVEVLWQRPPVKELSEKCNGFCGDYECRENQAVCKRKAQEK